MGGLMISITAIVLTIIFVPETPLRDVVLVGWGLFTLYGLLDGILGLARQANKKARALDQRFEWRLFKLFVLFLIGLFVLTLARDTLGLTSISLIGNIVLDITGPGILLLSFGFVCAMYGIEITDGLDGLVTGQFLINLFVYMVVALVLGFTAGSTNLLPYLALLTGSSFVYLYFNISPARVFMGGTGTLPVAFTLLLFSIITNTLPVFIIMGTMFWVEFLTSMIQMLSLRFRKKKIFKIAPIHHHFEAIGWPEAKVYRGSG
jgi:phospho-N-acetylmuramoyl-pentapeptide-transferase